MKQMLATLLTLALGFAGYVAAHGVAFFQLRMDLDAGARGFGGGRGDIWQAAWAHSFDNPVFGIGVNAFRYLPEQADFHPHSAPLQLLLETGFIGLGLSVALGVFILRAFYGYAQHNVYGVAALSSFLAFCTVSLANTSIFNIWWLAFFVMLCLMGWRTGWASARKEF